MRKLTPKQHKKYIHLCGKTGKQVEEKEPCKSCDKLRECLKTHTLVVDEKLLKQALEGLNYSGVKFVMCICNPNEKTRHRVIMQKDTDIHRFDLASEILGVVLKSYNKKMEKGSWRSDEEKIVYGYM